MEQDVDNTYDSVCSTCLSSDRSLIRINALKQVYQVFRLFMYDFAGYRFNDSLVEMEQLVCWECLALLKRFMRFKSQVHSAQKHLCFQYTDHTYTAQSLSTLGVSTKVNYDEVYVDLTSTDVNYDQTSVGDDSSQTFGDAGQQHSVKSVQCALGEWTLSPSMYSNSGGSELPQQQHSTLQSVDSERCDVARVGSDDVGVVKEKYDVARVLRENINLVSGGSELPQQQHSTLQSVDSEWCDVARVGSDDVGVEKEQYDVARVLRENINLVNSERYIDGDTLPVVGPEVTVAPLPDPKVSQPTGELEEFIGFERPRKEQPETGYITELMTEEEMVASREAKRRQQQYARLVNKCDPCIVGFKSQEEVEAHFTNRHVAKPGMTACKVCYMYFEESKLQSHLEGHYKRYICQLCRHTGYSKKLMALHVKSCSNKTLLITVTKIGDNGPAAGLDSPGPVAAQEVSCLPQDGPRGPGEDPHAVPLDPRAVHARESADVRAAVNTEVHSRASSSSEFADYCGQSCSPPPDCCSDSPGPVAAQEVSCLPQDGPRGPGEDSHAVPPDPRVVHAREWADVRAAVNTEVHSRASSEDSPGPVAAQEVSCLSQDSPRGPGEDPHAVPPDPRAVHAREWADVRAAVNTEVHSCASSSSEDSPEPVAAQEVSGLPQDGPRGPGEDPHAVPPDPRAVHARESAVVRAAVNTEVHSRASIEVRKPKTWAVPRVVVVEKRLSRNSTACYPCPECQSAFTTMRARKHHVARFHRERVQCDYCGKKFVYKDSLIVHIRRLHWSQQPREERPVCHKMMRSMDLKAHIKQHQDKGRYECSDCNKVFSQLQLLQLHRMLTAHATEQVFKYSCSVCNKPYRTKEAMQDHFNYHHPSRTTHKCPICDKPYASPIAVRMHMKAVHGGDAKPKPRKHLCGQCGKGFTTRKQLKDHEVVHSDERPFSCDVCLYTFKLRVALNKHRKRVHKIPSTREVVS